jgi:hypothetical protein
MIIKNDLIDGFDIEVIGNILRAFASKVDLLDDEDVEKSI